MKVPGVKAEQWYDFYDDFELIESSLATQYGIRIKKEANTMSWSEVKSFIGGLLPDTPLGRIISIRCEKDQKMLKNFTPDMRNIRNAWRNKQAAKKLNDVAALDREMATLEKSLELMFG